MTSIGNTQWKKPKNINQASVLNTFILVFSDPLQLWKIADNKLMNSANFWQTNDTWKFQDNDDKTMVYIINTAENKALENLSGGSVELRAFVENKGKQLWKKGLPNYEGYFPLSNLEFLTAISSSKLGSKGKFSTDCRIFTL